MSQINFGERYFAIRERIAEVVRGIHELAKATNTELSESFSSAAFENELRKPFLFVVCGEVNAGKSSFINGLFGYPLCKVNILPETDKVIWYRHGETPRDRASSPSLQESYLPIEFLRDFNAVDTPGTNSSDNAHLEETERLLPTAELIFFVFPVTNPWGAATWNLISGLPPECHERIVFILQQADQQDPEDLKITIQHMADLSTKRIGFVPQIFPVSGKLAFEAKQAGKNGERDYRNSGFPVLEDFISVHVCDSAARRKVLQTWRSSASTALASIENRVDEQTRVLGDQHHFLESLEREIDSMRESLVARLPSHLAGVTVVFETEALGVSKALGKSLGLHRSFYRIFVGDRTGSETESLFIERLRGAVETVAESDALDVVTACRDHWKELGIRVKDSIGAEIDDTSQVNQKLEKARIHFVNRIGRAAHEGIGNLHVRKDLEREVRRRNLALKSFTATTLLFLILGAICGILEVPWLPVIACGIALLFACGGVFIAISTKRKITDDFRRALLNACGAFADTLRTDYEDALRIFFQDYTTCLSSIRKHLSNEKLAIEPKLRRWHDLFLTLKSIEQDI